MFVHSYPEQRSVSQDIIIKGKLTGEKDTQDNREVKSMGYVTWTSYSAFPIFYWHIYKTGNKTCYKEICFSSCHALAFTSLGGNRRSDAFSFHPAPGIGIINVIGQ